jgi:6,7-dimethyl-8-ribityllumazine synthase
MACYNRVMPWELKPELVGHGMRVGVIVSLFNEFLTVRLLQGAQEALLQQGVKMADITVAWVPGSLELAPAAQRMASSGRWDALVALGAVVRGETAHFDLVAAESARGVAEVARQSGVPVAFGVLTTDTVEQASDRASGLLGNRGADAALAAVQMANLFRRLDAGPPAAASSAGPRPAAQARRRGT